MRRGAGWRVYPNGGGFVIEAPVGSRFELLNGSGQVLRAYELTGSALRVVEDIPAGLYLLREVRSRMGVRLNVVR